MPISSFYYYIQTGQIIPSIPSHSRVSRRHQLLSPNLLPLFNSSSPTTAQKPLPPRRHICDFSRGALNVRSTRSHSTLAPRPQICLIGGNGFVCSLSNELNSKLHYCFYQFLWCDWFCQMAIHSSKLTFVHTFLWNLSCHCNNRNIFPFWMVGSTNLSTGF